MKRGHMCVELLWEILRARDVLDIRSLAPPVEFSGSVQLCSLNGDVVVFVEFSQPHHQPPPEKSLQSLCLSLIKS